MSADAVNRTALRGAFLVLVADQVTKLAGTINPGGKLTPLHNPDYSLGVIAAPTVALITLSALTLVAATRYGLALASSGRIPTWVPGVVLGGAASNLADRLVLGAVRDFIPTPLVVFNIADVAVPRGSSCSPGQ